MNYPFKDCQAQSPFTSIAFYFLRTETGTVIQSIISFYFLQQKKNTNSYCSETTRGRINYDDIFFLDSLLSHSKHTHAHSQVLPGASLQDHSQGNRNGQWTRPGSATGRRQIEKCGSIRDSPSGSRENQKRVAPVSRRCFSFPPSARAAADAML